MRACVRAGLRGQSSAVRGVRGRQLLHHAAGRWGLVQVLSERGSSAYLTREGRQRIERAFRGYDDDRACSQGIR